MRGREIRLRITAFVLVFALLWGILPMQILTVAAEETDKEVQEETEDEPEPEIVKIRTVEEFTTFAAQCYLDSWSVGKYVVLEQDIDLTGVDFELIPVFAGTFDGDGHTISGFDSVGDGYVGGLFRYIAQNGVVKNLNLKGNVEGTEEKECIGSICGINYGTIRNCSFEGIISGRDTVGGIAGVNEATGFVENCSIHGHVTGYYTTGGIVGVNHGVVTYCSNYSGINDDTEWVEEDDEMGTGILLSISASDSDVEFYSGVDTGGIAGYSDGTIDRCYNYGRVGYEHTGYNIGGIAGRQTGVVFNCVNNGEVYGRKDVGGIVGQMEPYIEVDEAESLRNAVNKLHDLIEKSLNDLQAGKNAMKTDMDNLTAYSDAVVDSGHALADQITNLVDTNVEQLRTVGTRMEYVVDQLPAVVDNVSRAGEAFGSFSDVMERLLRDLAVEDETGGDTDNAEEVGYEGEISEEENSEEKNSDGQEGLSGAMNRLREDAAQVNSSADRIRTIITNEDGSIREWSELDASQQAELAGEVAVLEYDSKDMEDSISEMLSELSRWSNALSSEETKQDLESAMDYLQSMAHSLQDAAYGAQSIVNYMSVQPDIHFSTLGDEYRSSREALNGQLRGIANSLKSLSENASSYSDLENADLKAVNDQLNIVFNLLADNLSGYGGLSVEEMYEEVSDDEIDLITTGRLEACTNRGIVKGDINIGGIAGSMAIDEEDPEDNAAGSIDYEIGRRFIMKCIIDNCVNEGYITSKKDGAGGIVGYMAHGIVISCEGYGSVESTEGHYVGGICGQSLTMIRGCYALCDVSGGRNVGGIAGYAETLKDCYAVVNVESTAGRKGAIAGQIAEQQDTAEDGEANVCRNYYVDDVLCGIDNVSYVGIAEPISYQELLLVEGLPFAFRHLKVIYRVEDVELGTEEVAFGESLAGLHYPDIPAKEGSYGVWPDYSAEVMSGNLVIHGEYHDNVFVIESNEKDTENTEGPYQKPYALVEETFTEDTVLNVSKGGMNAPEEVARKEYVVYDVLLENSGISDGETFAVRLLNPYENAEVWGFADGAWTRLESRARGQYLQVDMTGVKESFCVVRTESFTAVIAVVIICAAVVLLIMVRLARKVVHRARGKRVFKEKK